MCRAQGKYTYREDMSPDEMAKVAMENYDPNFQSLVEGLFRKAACSRIEDSVCLKHVLARAANDILVGGFNFGTGSSREQAATALLHAGIKLLVCLVGHVYTRKTVMSSWPTLTCADCWEL